MPPPHSSSAVYGPGNTGQNGLSYLGPKIWNTLSSDLKSAKNINSFKHKIKNKFFKDPHTQEITERKKKFSTTEKEALAVVFAVNHFRTYLLGRKFSLITDHSALRWLHSIEAKGRIGRWVMELQEYDFDVKHRPGSDHGNADALSRLPNVKDSDSPILHSTDSYSYNCATTITPEYNLQAKQMEDPALSKIIQLKLDGFPKPPRFVWGHDPVMRAYWNCWDSLHVVNGLLVKSTGNNSFPQYAFVVPQ